MLLNNIYQAQMHSVLAIGFGVNSCFIFDENENLVDFVWRMKTFQVLS